MNIYKDDLEQTYSKLSDDELINLTMSKGLTDIALSVLAIELSKRGLTSEKILEFDKKATAEKRDHLYNSIMPTLPKIWVGFVCAAIFLVGEIIEVGSNYKGTFGPITTPVGIIGNIYWLFCIQRYHQIVNLTASDKYPISPTKAVLFHFIPFFNLYWIFKWPITMCRFLNEQQKIKTVHGTFIGTMLLVSFIMNKFDGTIGLTCMFLIGLYLNRKFKKLASGVNEEIQPLFLPDFE